MPAKTGAQTGTPRDALALYSWSGSVDWCLSGWGLRKRRSAPPRGPCGSRKTIRSWWKKKTAVTQAFLLFPTYGNGAPTEQVERGTENFRSAIVVKRVYTDADARKGGEYLRWPRTLSWRHQWRHGSPSPGRAGDYASRRALFLTSSINHSATAAARARMDIIFGRIVLRFKPRITRIPAERLNVDWSGQAGWYVTVRMGRWEKGGKNRWGLLATDRNSDEQCVK